MEIKIEWQKPIPLAKNNKPLFDDRNIPKKSIRLPEFISLLVGSVRISHRFILDRL